MQHQKYLVWGFLPLQSEVVRALGLGRHHPLHPWCSILVCTTSIYQEHTRSLHRVLEAVHQCHPGICWEGWEVGGEVGSIWSHGFLLLLTSQSLLSKGGCVCLGPFPFLPSHPISCSPVTCLVPSVVVGYRVCSSHAQGACTGFTFHKDASLTAIFEHRLWPHSILQRILPVLLKNLV